MRTPNSNMFSGVTILLRAVLSGLLVIQVRRCQRHLQDACATLCKASFFMPSPSPLRPYLAMPLVSGDFWQLSTCDFANSLKPSLLGLLFFPLLHYIVLLLEQAGTTSYAINLRTCISFHSAVILSVYLHHNQKDNFFS